MHPQTLRIYERKGLARPAPGPGRVAGASATCDLARLRRIQELTASRAEPRGGPAGPRARGRGAAPARPARPGPTARPRRPLESDPPPLPRATWCRSTSRPSPTAATDAGRRGSATDETRREDERSAPRPATLDREDPGGLLRRDPTALPSAEQSRGAPPAHLLAALLAQPETHRRPVLAKSGCSRRRRRSPLAESPRPPAPGLRGRPSPAWARAAREGLESADRLRARPGRRLPLGRAPAARVRRRARRRPRPAARRAARGPRQPPGHLAPPRGHLPGARAVRPRPHRARPPGQARPGHRARRGDPPGHPGALAPDEEQPGADRRARRRQDRDRRGPGQPHRRGRRPRGPEEQAGHRARPRLDGGRGQVPRRVRGAAEGGAEGDHRLRGRGRSPSSTSCTPSSAPARPRGRWTPAT